MQNYYSKSVFLMINHGIKITQSYIFTLRINPGHSDVIYVVENVLNYFLWLNSSNS